NHGTLGIPYLVTPPYFAHTIDPMHEARDCGNAGPHGRLGRWTSPRRLPQTVCGVGRSRYSIVCWSYAPGPGRERSHSTNGASRTPPSAVAYPLSTWTRPGAPRRTGPTNGCPPAGQTLRPRPAASSPGG